MKLVGRNVKHKTFGEGVVKEFREADRLENSVLVVSFDGKSRSFLTFDSKCKSIFGNFFSSEDGKLEKYFEMLEKENNEKRELCKKAIIEVKEKQKEEEKKKAEKAEKVKKTRKKKVES